MEPQPLSRTDVERLPNFRKAGAKEYSSTCPQCGGKDRFRFWPDDGNFWCRQCDFKGFILEVQQSFITEEQREAWKQAEEARRQKALEERLSARERVARMVEKVDWYHGQADQARSYWYSQGLTDSTISRFKLGFTHLCPTCPSSPSYVIPYFENGALISIRHRLANPPEGKGKYRPEFAGLPVAMFNTDSLIPQAEEFSFDYLPGDQALLVEGEVKAMYLDQAGFKATAIPGVQSWRPEWAKYFERMLKVFVVLDPGASNPQIGQDLLRAGLTVVSVTLPHKPDDFFVQKGGTIGDFIRLLDQGRIAR